MKGATIPATTAAILYVVSIHALQRVRLTKGGVFYVISCFNPRTQKSATMMFFYELALIDVSIHAPTKGATLFGFGFSTI